MKPITIAIALALANCTAAGSQMPASDLPQAPSLARASVRGAQRILAPDLRKSWISPDISRSPRLLFVSDLSNYDVLILSLPDLTLKGRLTGFFEPQGLCSDRKGNIWIADSGTARVQEYSRTGTLLNTISDYYGFPLSCAIDPTTGNIAVTDFIFLRGANVRREGGSGYNNLLIYTCASCTPEVINLPNFAHTFFAGYDPSGNLFVDGQSYSSTFVLAEVPAGSHAGHLISISGATIYFPGMVEWYRAANELAVGDQECGGQIHSCVYSIEISGSSGTVSGVTTLKNPSGGPVCDMVQGTLNPAFQKNLVGGDYESCGSTASSVDRWLYPAGGSPTNDITSLIGQPVGTAISTK